MPSKMFCFRKVFLVLLLSLGQGCDSSSCKCDVFCTSFAIDSHSCLVKSCQPGEHGCECTALPGILGNACYGCQLRQPLCAELKCIQNSPGAIFCRHCKETQFLSKFSVKVHPIPILECPLQSLLALKSTEDPRKVAAFQRLCGVEGPSGWAGAEQRGPVANGGPAGGQAHPAGNGAVPGAAGTPRRWRRRPRRNSLTEEEDGSQEFATRSRFLYYLFSLGTELGNELFYILFFPFCIWNVDAWLGRRLIIIWVWVMYLGQCTKDVIRWPRPASPPVVKLEVFYNSEYSMPSTHAMSGTAIPLALLLLSYGRWQYPLMFGLILAFCWCSLVCCSRIYMGMHSILDVIAGFLYAILILVVFHPVVDLIDNFNLTHKYAPLIIISLHLALGIFSFTLDTWSTSRGDTAQILGCGAGVACGSHVNYILGLQLDPPPHTLPLSLSSLTVTVFGKAILRLLIGVIVLLLTKVAMKKATIPLACKIFRIPHDDVRRARQRMEVELPYRYITYGMVGFSLMFIVPCLFHFIGLS